MFFFADIHCFLMKSEPFSATIKVGAVKCPDGMYGNLMSGREKFVENLVINFHKLQKFQCKLHRKLSVFQCYLYSHATVNHS